ncbi:MAG: MHYT domain-containing protein [Burkholderiaceae bacterium]|jgi:signal transduction histidine kinase
MVFSHQFGLVFLSVLAVTTSGMTAVAMTLRAANAAGRLRLLWAGGAALSLATGIWSMHFIGMLALQVPIGLSFDVGMTAFSFLPAMAASAGLLVASLRQQGPRWVGFTAPLLTAAGIVAMHYLGMLALTISPRPTYSPGSVLAAFLLAYGLSLLAFRILKWSARAGRKIGFARLLAVGLALGLGASGMHYLAMSGTRFAEQSVCLTATLEIAEPGLYASLAENAWLAVVIFLMLMLVNVAGLLATVYDARLEATEEGARRLAMQQQEVADFRSRIIRILSHELRTPLSVLTTGADLLQASTRPATPAMADRVDQYFANLHDGVGRIQQILSEALQFNQLESGEHKASPRNVVLSEMLDDLLAWVCTAEGRTRDQVRLQGDASTQVWADPIWSELIFRNLLSNALKYGAGQPIEVRWQTEPDGARVAVEVQDRGIGIPAELQPTLFRPFSRGQNVGAIQGTGLGLSLAERAALACGGELRLVSSSGEGTLFRCVLPAGR